MQLKCIATEILSKIPRLTKTFEKIKIEFWDHLYLKSAFISGFVLVAPYFFPLQ